MNNQRAIVIIGAPRSGTSLLHKILRESPGTVSVPHESSVIWGKYVDPVKNNWMNEGTDISFLVNKEIMLIRQEFNDKAMSDKKWKLWSKLGLMKKPLIAKIIRWLYPILFPLLSKLIKFNNTQSRLIEKTVHGGLWMDLIDEALDRPIFIHITRNGLQTIESMTGAWQQPERFGCYQVPKTIVHQNEKFKNTWCFPLIKNWEVLADRPLFEIATYQWLSIQNSILEYAKNKLPKECYIRIKLEDLVNKPEALFQLLDEIGVSSSSYFDKFRAEIPRVNAAEGKKLELSVQEKEWIQMQIKDVNKQMNYL